ncbi:MAG TPA: diguanylate cyclase [Steroidobacteraceae bacterium]|nr:diguanylate cyclase [Steroidobacteraceae bacterium]
MLPPGRINPDDFPDSRYAQALRSGVARLRFAPELEALYTQAHLQRMRLRVRIWFSLNCALALTAILGWLLGGAPRGLVWWAYALADLSAFILAWVAWTRAYPRLYMPIARVLVPVLGASIAVFIAQALANGVGQMIGVLTINVIAVFFFAGLLFRAALLATGAILVAFTAAAVYYGGPGAIAPSLPMLLLIAIIGIVGYRDIERSYRHNFLESALMAELVARDELSGLMNRRAFDEHMLRLWHHAQRDRRSLAVLMVDIDHFKAYNDAHGHQGGDGALRAVAQLLKGFARRPLDLAARYGGDEFVAVLYDLEREQVGDIAERMRRAVEQAVPQPAVGADATAGAEAPARTDAPAGSEAPVGSHAPAGSDAPAGSEAPAGAAVVTVSIGVGVVVPVTGRTFQGAVQLADEALYEAKQGGRNRVIIKAAEDYYRLQTGSFRATAIEPA